MMFGWKNQFSKVEAGVDPDFDDIPPITKKECKSIEPTEQPYVEAGIPICYGAWQRVEMEIKFDVMKKKLLDTGYENE